MQLKALHKNIYKLYAYARPQESLERYRKQYQESVQKYEEAKVNGASQALCQRYASISRATYYRRKKRLQDLNRGILPPNKRPFRLNKPRWTQAQRQLILKIRSQNPTYGKAKIAVILKRDHGQLLSESTVGRVLKSLMSQGLVTRSASALRVKRNRLFKKHAKPWHFKDYKTFKLGERVQLDHMTVTKNGVKLKHFQAWERRSKYLFEKVYSNAKASSAKRFLLDFVKLAPFQIHSIQVDGGSEFRAEFEDACAELNIPLIVLPPAKPKYNGGVERANRSFREEFYNLSTLIEDSVGGIQAALTKAVQKYNAYRPHFALKGLTPLAYLQNQNLEAPQQSHII